VPDQDPRTPGKSSIGSIGALSAVGIGFVIAVTIGFGAGWMLDRWAGTSPLFVILFFFFGVAAGIVNLVRTVNAVTRDQKR
jgi:ATP synthase protein I